MNESGGRESDLPLFFLDMDGINKIYSTDKNKVLDRFLQKAYSISIRLLMVIEEKGMIDNEKDLQSTY